MPNRPGSPTARSMPSDCWSKISSIVLGDGNLTPSTSPALETIDWLRATDRALPCPLLAGISARRQASVATAARSKRQAERLGRQAVGLQRVLQERIAWEGDVGDPRKSFSSRPMRKSASSGPASRPRETCRSKCRSPNYPANQKAKAVVVVAEAVPGSHQGACAANNDDDRSQSWRSSLDEWRLPAGDAR
jgi:hypothetical protein